MLGWRGKRKGKEEQKKRKSQKSVVLRVGEMQMDADGLIVHSCKFSCCRAFFYVRMWFTSCMVFQWEFIFVIDITCVCGSLVA